MVQYWYGVLQKNSICFDIAEGAEGDAIVLKPR